ncbi:hypothetical protein N7478_000134 [Penicillium angulare]|uniref:uncharacterized protein n=1 Tax=Penicillium angulare TaxID=116970 RepID=UPI00253FF930|nr:uncharacterized protein N7478_000134 [Penicillium angulare]KAJ5290883.1 hypothetical protein N7478_000134 [Penicillium angulare]
MSLSTFPPDDAGPRQVRQYIVDHLMSKHDTTLEFAQKAADLWPLGRGRDFRKATMTVWENAVKAYSPIFGDAAAPYVLQSVREDCWNNWRASPLGIMNLRAIIACFTLSVLFFIWTRTSARFAKDPIPYIFRNTCWPIGPPLLICAYLEHGHSTGLPVFFWIVGFFGTFMAISATAVLIADGEKPRFDENAEEKLKGKPS